MRMRSVITENRHMLHTRVPFAVVAAAEVAYQQLSSRKTVAVQMAAPLSDLMLLLG